MKVGGPSNFLVINIQTWLIVRFSSEIYRERRRL